MLTSLPACFHTLQVQEYSICPANSLHELGITLPTTSANQIMIHCRALMALTKIRNSMPTKSTPFVYDLFQSLPLPSLYRLQISVHLYHLVIQSSKLKHTPAPPFHGVVYHNASHQTPHHHHPITRSRRARNRHI